MTASSTPNQSSPAATSAIAGDIGATISAATAAQQTPVDSGQTIPKHRFDEVNAKRKEAEAALEDVAASVIESMVPEAMCSIVPDLPAAQKIKWVYEAAKAGIFTAKQQSGPDSKRPGEKPPQDFTGLSPQTIMAHGYSKK